jgi:hypothetical protein
VEGWVVLSAALVIGAIVPVGGAVVEGIRPLERSPMKAALVVVVVLVFVAATAPVAEARRCRVGNSGITVNRAGDVARFSQLRALRGMNCASARYVLNRWVRRSFRRSFSRRFRRRFWDGYVTWHCRRRTRFQWQCREFTSGTVFRFRAVIIA